MPVASTDHDALNVYPNPCSSNVDVALHPNDEARSVTLAMMDMLGKTLYSRDFSAGTENIRLDLSDFPNGIYILQLTDDNGNITKKRLLKR